jgi:hypothetical protein
MLRFLYLYCILQRFHGKHNYLFPAYYIEFCFLSRFTEHISCCVYLVSLIFLYCTSYFTCTSLVTLLLCGFPCRFHTVAYLSQIWWFEVRGEVEFCFPEGTYSLFYRVHLGRPFKRLGRRVCSSEHIHGWDIKPVRFQMSTSDGQQAQSKCYLTDPGVWINHHVGDFVVKDSSKPTNIRFAMIQIDCTHTKGGLCVDSVVVKPQYLTQKKLPRCYV